MYAFALSIGITGHRTFSPEHLPRISEQVRGILRSIQQEAQSIADTHAQVFTKAPLLRVVSCLSEGADRLVPGEGLALGYTLKAVLPFPGESEVHARDLAEPAQQASRAELQNFLRQAESIFEFTPEYVGEEFVKSYGDSVFSAAQRQKAYAEAGEYMLRHSNILMAIWHGKPQLAVGSTAQTMERALQMNIPVIWIHATEKCLPVICSKEDKVSFCTKSITEDATALRHLLQIHLTTTLKGTHFLVTNS